MNDGTYTDLADFVGDRRQTIPQPAAVSQMFRDAADLLEQAAERFGLSAIAIYDAGAGATGLCTDCGAWPGERHDLTENPACPARTDDAPGEPRGAVYLGQWSEVDMPAVRACQAEICALVHAFDENEAIESDLFATSLRSAIVRLRAFAERPVMPPACRCGHEIRAGACSGDPTPPRCGRCRHALSHGTCPLCQPVEWAEATGHLPPGIADADGMVGPPESDPLTFVRREVDRG